MNRRDFLASSIAAAGASAMGSDASAQSSSKPMPQYYELRQYQLRTTMRQDFADYLKVVSVPALNRAGISPVGVFTVAVGPDSPRPSFRIVSNATALLLSTFTRSPRINPAMRKTLSTGLSTPFVASERKPSNHG